MESKEIVNESILRYNSAKTSVDLGDAPIDNFQLWCVWKHNEIRIKTKTASSSDAPQVEEISKRLATYGADLSWAISEYFLVSRELKTIKDQRQHWYNEKHLEAVRAIKQKGNNSPAVKTIDAFIEQTYHDDHDKWQDKMHDVEMKQQMLEKYVTLWMKMDKVYTSLLYDLNTEFYRAYKQHEKNPKNPYEVKMDTERSEFLEFLKKSGAEDNG